MAAIVTFTDRKGKDKHINLDNATSWYWSSSDTLTIEWNCYDSIVVQGLAYTHYYGTEAQNLYNAIEIYIFNQKHLYGAVYRAAKAYVEGPEDEDE